MDYILGHEPKCQGCLFCLPPDHLGPLEERLVLHSDKLVLVIMNRFPYTNGHLMIAPRRHVPSLSLSSPEERAAVGEWTAKVTDILDSHMKPDGYNIGINQGQAAGAGIAEHLHQHVVPRWSGDTNFMAALAEVRVIPEHLLATYRRLAELFN
jgi:ATP adenylyltransferase